MPTTQTQDQVRVVLERLRPTLFGLIRAFRIPRQDAEDILQQAFLRYVQKHRMIENPDAWLPKVAKRECLLYLRAKRRRVWEVVDGSLLELVSNGTGDPEEACLVRQDLEKALGEVSPKCRNLLRMRYVLGLTDTEIAEEQGYHSSSVSRLVLRCIAALLRVMTRNPKVVT